MSWIIVAEIVLYCICMIGIGVYFSRKKLSQEEFMLGGNKLPGWALAFSERAACESVYLLMGLTGFVYANEESYLDNSYYTLLSWTNNNEWIYIDIPYYNQKEELRPESVSINKIVF